MEAFAATLAPQAAPAANPHHEQDGKQLQLLHPALCTAKLQPACSHHPMRQGDDLPADSKAGQVNEGGQRLPSEQPETSHFPLHHISLPGTPQQRLRSAHSLPALPGGAGFDALGLGGEADWLPDAEPHLAAVSSLLGMDSLQPLGGQLVSERRSAAMNLVWHMEPGCASACTQGGAAGMAGGSRIRACPDPEAACRAGAQGSCRHSTGSVQPVWATSLCGGVRSRHPPPCRGWVRPHR